ncbi:MAG: hypothetical protein AAF368_20270, partial [Planctomycetota bacterium]
MRLDVVHPGQEGAPVAVRSLLADPLQGAVGQVFAGRLAAPEEPALAGEDLLVEVEMLGQAGVLVFEGPVADEGRRA